jgi:hypothetical protein
MMPLLISNNSPAIAARPSRLMPSFAMAFEDMIPAWMKREPPVYG